jgi:hypothetical protein
VLNKDQKLYRFRKLLRAQQKNAARRIRLSKKQEAAGKSKAGKARKSKTAAKTKRAMPRRGHRLVSHNKPSSLVESFILS